MRKEDMLEKIETATDAMEELKEMLESGPEKKEERGLYFMSLADAAALIRDGFGRIFHVGDVIVSKHADVGRIAWNVIGINADKDPENEDRPTLTLHMRDVLLERWRFDGSKPGAPWGRNAWAESDIRRELNGDFLGGFSAAEQEAMIAVDKVTYKNGTPDTTRDKLFLLSCTEAGFTSKEYSIQDEGPAYPFFTDCESRKKYDSDGEARYWWLRSPVPGGVYDPRVVSTSGALNYDGAGNGYGAAAACVIG